MAMLGLDLSAVESRDGTMFEAITRRCGTFATLPAKSRHAIFFDDE
jgi:hypothetical protein